jgi:hypothetical protein
MTLLYARIRHDVVFLQEHSSENRLYSFAAAALKQLDGAASEEID